MILALRDYICFQPYVKVFSLGSSVKCIKKLELSLFCVDYDCFGMILFFGVQCEK